MARQKRTRGRKQKTFGRLPVSALAGNADEWIRSGSARFLAAVARARKEKTGDPNANVYVEI